MVDSATASVTFMDELVPRVYPHITIFRLVWDVFVSDAHNFETMIAAVSFCSVLSDRPFCDRLLNLSLKYLWKLRIIYCWLSSGMPDYRILKTPVTRENFVILSHWKASKKGNIVERRYLSFKRSGVSQAWLSANQIVGFFIIDISWINDGIILIFLYKKTSIFVFCIRICMNERTRLCLVFGYEWSDMAVWVWVVRHDSLGVSGQTWQSAVNGWVILSFCIMYISRKGRD